MEARWTEATVGVARSITLGDLPFHPGETVEVIISKYAPVVCQKSGLRHSVLAYDEPLETGAIDDWEALQ